VSSKVDILEAVEECDSKPSKRQKRQWNISSIFDLHLSLISKDLMLSNQWRI
jgi:hypothetical protein